ncbi:hypothetical protein ACRAWC_11470 [Leifsonia sp. L25]|uniref:hypothetical protein n=1 Tax=Actinomycetes TaxID=1760 RepID=UPI003D682D03
MLNDDILTFRRQFLLTSGKTDELPGWPVVSVPGHTLYSHPELGVTVHEDNESGVVLLLLGYAIDRDRPRARDADILATLATARREGRFWPVFSDLSGRFVLFVFDGDEIEAMHDPCGLRAAEYTYVDGFHVASQSNLLSLVASVARGKRYQQYITSYYGINVREDHLTADTTLFDDVDRLTPNHVLKVGERRQERYWPVEPLRIGGSATKDVAAEALGMLRASIAAAKERFSLALPLTCGVDSRSLLSAASTQLDGIWTYTMLYRWLQNGSPDLAIPRSILGRLNHEHHVFDAKTPPPKAFLDHYRANSPMAHPNDATIAYGLSRAFPPGFVGVKGNIAELVRCYYNTDGLPLDIRSVKDILDIIPHWETVPFIVESVQRWYDASMPVSRELGWDLDLLFHWEHQIGTWQAQSQLEWDIAQEVFTPYNDRRLLTRMLAAPPGDRIPPVYTLFRELIAMGEGDLLREPINPSLKTETARRFFWRARTRAMRDMRKMLRPSYTRR